MSESGSYLIGGLIVLGVVLLRVHFTYWSRRGIRAITLRNTCRYISNLVAKKESWGSTLIQLYNEIKTAKLGYVGMYVGLRPFFVPIDPDLINRILTADFKFFTKRMLYRNEANDPLSHNLATADVEKWRVLRTKLTPLFTPAKLRISVESLADATEKLARLVRKAAEANEAIDIAELAEDITSDKISSFLLGYDCNSDKGAELKKNITKSLPTTFYKLGKFSMSFATPTLFRLAKMRVIDRDVEDFFLKTVKQTMDYRANNNLVRNDFMQQLMQLHDDAAGLSLIEITAEVFFFLFAGTTSASTITFLMYEMAVNQELQRELRDEILEVAQKHDGKIGYDAILEMGLLEKCLKETLRKYPPVPVFSRECTSTYTIPGTDSKIAPGTIVTIPVIGLHYDPDFYPDPEKFDPNRYDSEVSNKVWLPFGEGPRNCIGWRFSAIEIKSTVASLLQNYRFTFSGKIETPMIFNPSSLVLIPKNKVLLSAERI